VANLSPAVTWQVLKEHIKTAGADPSGSAHVRVITTADGRSLLFGFIEFRNTAAADAAVWTLHNSTLDNRLLFVRPDCEMLDLDEKEGVARRESAAKQVQLVSQVATWFESAPPLVEWGWAERLMSCWVDGHSDGGLPPAARDRSLEWFQFCTRMRKLVTSRMDVQQLPGLYERSFGARIDPKALGCTSLREALLATPAIQVESQGQRLSITPVSSSGPSSSDKRSRGSTERGGDRGGDRGRSDRDREGRERGRDGRERERDSGRERERDRPRDSSRDRERERERGGERGADRGRRDRERR